MATDILIVDDDASFRIMLKTFLEKNNYRAYDASSGTDCLKQLTNINLDIIVLDFFLPDYQGLDLLKRIKSISSIPVIIVTNYAQIKTAVQTIKMGAYDYVTKPINSDEILYTISKALKNPNSSTIPEDFLTGNDHKSQELEQNINLIAPTEMTVIIEGETGTGKEYVAKRIHDNSSRSNQPFIAIDCGALTEELAGSELFGHVQGAFTGAVAEKTGQFIEANHGTLFLDEIGNLSYDIQVKLLRALQERKIKKLGSNKDTTVDVRLITATNENLWHFVSQGKFREDLYHRLNEFIIKVPPLRSRGSDIERFTNHFINIANTELNKQIEGADKEVLNAFYQYSWPGNIREMKNVIKKAVLLCNSNTLTLNELPMEIYNQDISQKNNHKQENQAISDFNIKAHNSETEKELIQTALLKAKYNKSKAAKMLHIDRKTLYNKIEQYNLDNN